MRKRITKQSAPHWAHILRSLLDLTSCGPGRIPKSRDKKGLQYKVKILMKKGCGRGEIIIMIQPKGLSGYLPFLLLLVIDYKHR